MGLPNPNPFETCKNDFKQELGKDWQQEPALYLQYVQYRVQVNIAIVNTGIANQLPMLLETVKTINGKLKQK